MQHGQYWWLSTAHTSMPVINMGGSSSSRARSGSSRPEGQQWQSTKHQRQARRRRHKAAGPQYIIQQVCAHAGPVAVPGVRCGAKRRTHVHQEPSVGARKQRRAAPLAHAVVVEKEFWLAGRQRG